MVSYGPWIQDPDLDGSPARTTTENRVWAATETPFQSPRYNVTNADLEDAFDVAQAAALLGVHDPANLSLWGVVLTQGYQLSFPNWKTNWGAEVNRHLVTIGPGSLSYNPPDYGFPAPEGAIGIDYENLPYDPDEYPWRDAPGTQLDVRLLATTRFGGFWYDDQGSGDWSIGTSVPGSALRLQAGAGALDVATVPPPPNVPAPPFME